MPFRFDKLRKGFIFGAVFNLYYCRKHSHLLLIHKRMEQVFSYIIGLGAAVMMPIIFYNLRRFVSESNSAKH